VNSRIKWNLKRVVKYLDQTYPQVGLDCPFFPVVDNGVVSPDTNKTSIGASTAFC
jgi:hypothetical protein